MLKPIVLIHGLFLNHASWEAWAERYRDRGHPVHVAAWPGLEGSVEELRSDPTPLTRLSIEKVLDHLESLVSSLASEPILIGHSFGGLFAQLLAYRGHGCAVVGLDATAPAGVWGLPFSTLKSSAPVLANPFNVGHATMLSAEQFHYAFTNTLSADEARSLYDRYAIPCADRVLFEGAFENFSPHSHAHVDTTAERPPILLMAGGADHLVPPGYSRAHFELIAKSPSVTAFREYPGRPHFTGAVPGWEALADDALAWALAPAASRPPTAAA